MIFIMSCTQFYTTYISTSKETQSALCKSEVPQFVLIVCIYTGRSGVPADCSGNANDASSEASEPVIIPPQDNTVLHQ
jgi:hypothetical protein